MIMMGVVVGVDPTQSTLAMCKLKQQLSLYEGFVMADPLFGPYRLLESNKLVTLHVNLSEL